MDAAGVVAEHPAEGAVGVGRGVGAEGQAVRLGRRRGGRRARSRARPAPAGGPGRRRARGAGTSRSPSRPRRCSTGPRGWCRRRARAPARRTRARPRRCAPRRRRLAAGPRRSAPGGSWSRRWRRARGCRRRSGPRRAPARPARGPVPRCRPRGYWRVASMAALPVGSCAWWSCRGVLLACISVVLSHAGSSCVILSVGRHPERSEGSRVGPAIVGSMLIPTASPAPLHATLPAYSSAASSSTIGSTWPP